MKTIKLTASFALAPLAGALLARAACAQTCTNRGQLDDMYCDADKNMVADAPADKSTWKNPSTLIFTYTPIKDSAAYQRILANFQRHLGKCTGKKAT